ncbi:hypothetical protein CY35_01G126800 [Sphagnum magellanicum]|nr:hypothetical protein CY35_01G126800 [Sphagnum magellanicum]
MRTSGLVRPPRVLITVYGSRLQTLHRLLLSLLSSHFGPDAVGGENRGLVRDGDSADYVSFLEDSFAVLAENAPPIGAVSLRQRWSQQQVVERVIALQFRQEGNPAHVLCLGYRQLRPTPSRRQQGSAPQGLECKFPNIAVEVVNSQSWVTLLSRVGDETMLHILSHSAIFVPLPNHCFLQVTGLPFTVTASLQKQIIQATLTSRIGWKGKKFQCQRIGDQSLNTGNDGCPEVAVHGACQEDDKKAGKDSEERLDCMSKKQCAKKKQLELNTVFLDSPLTQTLSSQQKRKGSKTAECSSSGAESQVPKRIKLTGSDEPIHFSRNKQTVDSVYVLQKRRVKEIAMGCKKPSVCPSSTIFRMKRENHLPESQDSGKVQKHVKKGGDLKTKEVGSAHGRIHELTAGFSSELLCCSKQIGFSECLQGCDTVPVSSEGNVHGVLRSKKQLRPSSWQRRKARMMELPIPGCHMKNMEALTEICPSTAIDNSTSVYSDGAFKNDGRSPSPTAEACTSGHAKLCDSLERSSWDDRIPYHAQDRGLRCRASQCANMATKGSAGDLGSKKATGAQLGTSPILGPSCRVIDRTPIFYNSSFACHAGLPANHILNKTTLSDTGMSNLFAAIFKTQNTSGTCSSPCAENVQDLSGGRFEEWLVKHCGYARLLHRHCPLPFQFWPSQAVQHGLAAEIPSMPKQQIMTPEIEHARVLEEGYATQEDDMDIDLISSININPAELGETQSPGQDVHGGQYTVDKSANKLTNPRSHIEEDRFFSGTSNMTKGGHGALGSSQRRAVRARSQHKNAADEGRKKAGCHDEAMVPELITCYTEHRQVVAFLWAVCRSLVPEEFLGSTRAWRSLCHSIACFVSLRRHETFYVQHILNKLQVKGFLWFNMRRCFPEKPTRNCRQSHVAKHSEKGRQTSARERMTFGQMMLEDWLHWFFASLIVPLIRAHFYVTESEHHRQNILYYRKPVWSKIQSLALRELMSTSFTKLSPTSVAALLQKRAFGFSQIRLLPKQNGVRPIANLGNPSKCALHIKAESQPRSFKDIFGSFQISGQNSRDGFKNYAADLQQPSPKKNSSKTGKKHVRFYFKSINSVLKDTHLCLKYEQGCWPEDLGSSVFGYRDAYIKLLPFVMKMKATPGGVPPLYMAVCDISKAYDTIQQEKLCEVVQDFVRSPLYVVLRYASLFPTVGALRVAYKRACMRSDHPLNFLNFSMDVTAKHSHSIVHDQAVVTRMMQEQVVSLVKEHVKRNIVKVGSKYYQQKVGIPQGSVLSSLLCSLFYGHLDTHILLPLLQSSDTEISKGCPDLQLGHEINMLDKDKDMGFSGVGAMNVKHAEFLEAEAEGMLYLLLGRQSISDNTNSLAAAPDKNPEAGKPAASDCILLRFIDDSLFISTSENMVVKFVETMHKGFAEYGCHANQGKTAVSFDLKLTDGQGKNVKNVYMSADGACFMRWSGLLINCRTLEIQADYTRYCGEHIKGTLTVIRKRNPGAQVPHKLCHFMRAKCHPLLYDIRINSPSTIRLNAFQAFMLCAMKLHTYLQCLPRSAPHHPHFLFQAIVGSFRYMYGLLKQRMQATEANVHMALEVKEVEWLGLVAFLKMLQRKQSQYRILISLLQTRLHKSNHHAREQFQGGNCLPTIMLGFGCSLNYKALAFSK